MTRSTTSPSMAATRPACSDPPRLFRPAPDAATVTPAPLTRPAPGRIASRGAGRIAGQSAVGGPLVRRCLVGLGLGLVLAVRPPAAGAAPAPERADPAAPALAAPALDTAPLVVEPEIIASGNAADRALEEGYRALRLGAIDSARAAYATAVRLAPQSADAHLGLAAALQAQGQPLAAAAQADHAVRLRPTDPIIRGRLVALLSTLAPEIALDKLGVLAARHPGDPALFEAIGLMLLTLNRPADAAAALDHAAHLAPGDVRLQTNLAIAADRAGHSDQAMAAYRRALDLLRAGGPAEGIAVTALARRLRWLDLQATTPPLPNPDPEPAPAPAPAPARSFPPTANQETIRAGD